MAYVTVPKDLTKVKNKVAFNLTKRQIVCLSDAGLPGDHQRRNRDGAPDGTRFFIRHV